MKRALLKFVILVPVLTYLLCACAPVTEIINVEARIPAEYPIDFNEKSVAVFFSVTDEMPDESFLYKNDSILMQQLATGIASTIEKNLLLDEGGVFVFKHFPDANTVYDMSYIHELSFNSNSDIIIIVDSVEVGHIGLLDGVKHNFTTNYISRYIFAPFRSSIKVYDGITAKSLAYINQSDTVFWEILSKNDLRPEVMAVRARQSMPNVSRSIGEEVVKALFPTWQAQKRTLYLYPTQAWINAANYAKEFKWKEAMDFWLKQSKDKDPVKAAVAAYNIAIACELTDRHELALEWAEFSLKRYVLPGVSDYKQLLTEKLEKSTR
ncbi:MAG: DUF6340 family protein [Bacteroidales bacterium]|nr:DUF6340 family protein [Bacteroidales bacterium]